MVTPQNTPEAAAENKFIVPVEGTRPVAVMIDNEGTKPYRREDWIKPVNL
jgi:hypothetical protein